MLKIVDFLLVPLTLWGMSFSIIDILLKLILPIVLAVITYSLLLMLTRRVILRSLRIKKITKEKVYRFIRVILRVIYLVCLPTLILTLLGPDVGKFISGFWNILSTPLLTAGSSQITIVTILLTVPIFFIGSWLSRVTKRFVDHSLLNKITLAEGIKFTISILLRNIVLILSILIGLSIIGLDLSSLAILFGVLGIGLGFGLQNFVANFVAGFILIFERPIKEGDRIQVGSLEGEVMQIRLRSTLVTTLTNETIIVPNRNLIDDKIHNFSYGDDRIIIINQVQVSYTTDLNRVRETLIDLTGYNPYALASPQPEVRLLEFGDSGILIELRTWIRKATEKQQAISWINFEIWKRFKSERIEIPYPQLDLHVKNGPASVGPG